MSNEDHSITHMMEVLNPKQIRRTELFKSPISLTEYESPLKRRLSSDSSTDSPDKRPKIDNSLDVSWIASPREARRLRLELLETRNRNSDLENRIQQMHSFRKEAQTLFDNEIKALQFQRDNDKKTIEQLEKQMHSIRKREKEAKLELEEVQEDMMSMKLEYENHIRELETNVTELQSQLDVYEHTEIDQINMVQSDNNHLTEALKTAEKEAKLYKDLVNDLKARLARLTNTSNEVEIKEQLLQTANLKIKELEYTLESYGEWQIQCKMQQQKLANYSDIVKENLRMRDETKRLKEELQNKLMLEEQVHDLNTRLENYRQHDKKLSTLQASNTQLEQIVNEWHVMAREIIDTPCSNSALPRNLKQIIDRLQQQEITLTSEKIQLESQTKVYQQDLKISKAENEKLQKLNADLQTVQQQHQSLVHRLQKKLQLISRERDSYRAQLDSYEKDLTVYIAPNSQGGNPQLNVLKERIECLEKMLDGYREMNTNLEGQLREAQPHLNTESLIPVRSEQLTRLQDEIEKLTNENNRLTQRCDELEIRLEEELVGKDVVHGKVLHLKMNPTSESIADEQADINKLREENDRLKRKIRNMEEGLDHSKLSESICSTREVKSLKEQNKAMEIKMQRLKEFFKSSSNEFRDVCYMLLGYKIDRINSTLYKLSSMYAENPEDHLEFQVNQDGALNMIETQFSSSLEDLIDLHLRQHSSIPAFLSAVTMDLFGRTTMSARTFVE